jgi:antitoxin component of RelBE/YafQ-DinJ toxin-antitoxin module
MTKKPRRGGRQPLPDSERKTVLSIRVHPEVRKTFEHIAAKYGGTVSKWVELSLRQLTDEQIAKMASGVPLKPQERRKIKRVPKP